MAVPPTYTPETSANATFLHATGKRTRDPPVAPGNLLRSERRYAPYEYREMESRCTTPSRRLALGAVVASVMMTRLAFGQTPPNTALRQAEANMKIRIEFNGTSMTATLYDNPSARDLASMLPLDLTIDDYSTNEKIAYLPRKLTEEGGGPFGNEASGDLGYYAPWGNLVFYHGSYCYSSGLIRLGRIDGDIAPLLTRGKFDLRIEPLP